MKQRQTLNLLHDVPGEYIFTCADWCGFRTLQPERAQELTGLSSHPDTRLLVVVYDYDKKYAERWAAQYFGERCKVEVIDKNVFLTSVLIRITDAECKLELFAPASDGYITLSSHEGSRICYALQTRLTEVT